MLPSKDFYSVFLISLDFCMLRAAVGVGSELLFNAVEEGGVGVVVYAYKVHEDGTYIVHGTNEKRPIPEEAKNPRPPKQRQQRRVDLAPVAEISIEEEADMQEAMEALLALPHGAPQAPQAPLPPPPTSVAPAADDGGASSSQPAVRQQPSRAAKRDREPTAVLMGLTGDYLLDEKVDEEEDEEEAERVAKQARVEEQQRNLDALCSVTEAEQKELMDWDTIVSLVAALSAAVESGDDAAVSALFAAPAAMAAMPSVPDMSEKAEDMQTDFDEPVVETAPGADEATDMEMGDGATAVSAKLSLVSFGVVQYLKEVGMKAMQAGKAFIQQNGAQKTQAKCQPPGSSNTTPRKRAPMPLEENFDGEGVPASHTVERSVASPAKRRRLSRGC